MGLRPRSSASPSPKSPPRRAARGAGGRAGARGGSFLHLGELAHPHQRRGQQPDHACDRCGRTNPERRPQPDPGTECAAEQGAERPHAVVDDHVGAGDPRPQPVGDQRGLDRPADDVEDHHAEAREELGREQQRQHRPVRPVRERYEQERRREEHAADHEGRAYSEPSAYTAGEDRADQPADRGGAEHQPENARPHAERARRVEDEQGPENEVEEVDRRRRKQRGADHRRAPEVAQARLHVPLGRLLGRRLDRLDRAQRERGSEERDRVRDQRPWRREHLNEHAADARAADERERAAAVEQRVRLEVALPRDERDEQRRVRDEEEDAQRPDEEGDDVELGERQDVEPVGDRDREEQRGAAEDGDEHRLAAAPAPVEPGTRVQREDQGRGDPGRGQIAHLGRRRVQRQHARERQRDQRDLVAEQRHRLAEPEPAEVALAENRGDAGAPRRGGIGQLERVHALTTVMSPLIELARSSTCGASPSGGTSETGSSERTSPLRERASTQSVEPSRIPTLMSPEAVFTSTLPCATEPIVWSPEAEFALTEADASRTMTSPDAVLTSSALPASLIWTSPDAELIFASPESSLNCTSPEPVSTLAEPRRPWPSRSAEPLLARTLESSGHRISISTSAPRRKRLGPRTSTRISSPRCSTRASSIAVELASLSRSGSSLTVVSVVSEASSRISPEPSRTSRRTGLGVWKVSVLIACPGCQPGEPPGSPRPPPPDRFAVGRYAPASCRREPLRVRTEWDRRPCLLLLAPGVARETVP